MAEHITYTGKFLANPPTHDTYHQAISQHNFLHVEAAIAEWYTNAIDISLNLHTPQDAPPELSYLPQGTKLGITIRYLEDKPHGLRPQPMLFIELPGGNQVTYPLYTVGPTDVEIDFDELAGKPTTSGKRNRRFLGTFVSSVPAETW